MALMMPVSSSMLRKTKPLAVPGRWRTMTAPAMRTRRPLGMCARSMARVTPQRVHLGAAVGHGVLADGQAGAAVIGRTGALRCSWARAAKARRFLPAARAAGPPAGWRAAPARARRGGAACVERIQRADFRQAVELVLAQLGDAQGQIVDAGERAGAREQWRAPASSRSPRA